jgi:hypothetical protein
VIPTAASLGNTVDDQIKMHQQRRDAKALMGQKYKSKPRELIENQGFHPRFKKIAPGFGFMMNPLW